MIKIIASLSVLALLLAQSGCQKLPDGAVPSTATLDAIPLEYGEVIGVTPHGAYPYTAVLWLEKPDKTIVALRVDLSRHRVGVDPVVTIPRR